MALMDGMRRLYIATTWNKEIKTTAPIRNTCSTAFFVAKETACSVRLANGF
jgi:hypothetical protein